MKIERFTIQLDPQDEALAAKHTWRREQRYIVNEHGQRLDHFLGFEFLGTVNKDPYDWRKANLLEKRKGNRPKHLPRDQRGRNSFTVVKPYKGIYFDNISGVYRVQYNTKIISGFKTLDDAIAARKRLVASVRGTAE